MSYSILRHVIAFMFVTLHLAAQDRVVKSASTHGYLVSPNGQFVKFNTKSLALEAKGDLQWGEEAFDVLETKSNGTSLYGLIALNGRDDPAPEWRLVKSSLPSLSVKTETPLGEVQGLPVLVSTTDASVVVVWNNFAKNAVTAVTVQTFSANTLKRLSATTIPNAIVSRNAFMLTRTSRLIAGMHQIDIATGKSETLPTFASLSEQDQTTLLQEFGTPDAATKKPVFSFGPHDAKNGKMLLSADDPNTGRKALWTFDLLDNRTSRLHLTGPGVARLSPSASWIVVQHTSPTRKTESTGNIELINTATGKSQIVAFPELAGNLVGHPLVCVSDDSVVFISEDVLYAFSISAPSLLRKINASFVIDQETSCILAPQ